MPFDDDQVDCLQTHETQPAPDADVPAVVRPWSAVVCGLPGDGTLLIVDWLVLACQQRGLGAYAVALGERAGMPHGMFLEVVDATVGEDDVSGMPGAVADLVVAGDHLELVRAIDAGYVHQALTTVVASCGRSFEPAERQLWGEMVLSERDIDRVASACSARYVAFDGPEVAGWYGLPAAARPALLFGALCGSAATALTRDDGLAAIDRLGIDVDQNVRAFRMGLRLGRRSGGRVRRTQTAPQFVRKRRAQLPRGERAGFEMLVDRIDQEFIPEHRPVLREAVFALVDYQSAEYAARLVDSCVVVAREELSAAVRNGTTMHPDESVVPAVARNLTSLLAYHDLAHMAHVKLRRRRLCELRKRHGIQRGSPYRVTDIVPLNQYELSQVVGRRAAARADRTGSPLLARQQVLELDTTTLRGALRMHRLRRLRRHRLDSGRHQSELAAAELYVAVVRDALQTGDFAIARIVAASGSIVQGFGAARAATRASAMSFWGRVVRHALSLDRSRADGSLQVTRTVVPHVYTELARRGHLALWDYAGNMVGIALHVARDGSYDEALMFVKALCGVPHEPTTAAGSAALAAPPATGLHGGSVLEHDL